ncbi:MAG: hypothetical protein M3P06_24735 [Acidobacteriota bacterium]|nr:hypothetical protein [Acidobacteriota bacterium]
MPRTVAIVFAEDFSAQLEKLSFHTAVWLVDTPANRAAAEEAWQRAIEWPHISVTLFRSSAASPSGDDWRALLEQIALQKRTVDSIDIFGAELTPVARATLENVGYERFEETPSGFRARR